MTDFHKFYVDHKDMNVYLDGKPLKGVKNFDLRFEVGSPPKLQLEMIIDYDDDIPELVLANREELRAQIKQLHKDVLG